MRIKKTILTVLIVCITHLYLVACSSPIKSTELTISAAASLRESVEEIIILYEKAHPNIKITLNLGASGSLVQQIEQGASVDLFISASKKYMDGLASKGLLKDGTRVDLLANKLVLIAPSDSTLISSFEDLAVNELKELAIGDPGSVPAGQYAKETLESLGIWEKTKGKVVFGKDVKTVLTWVETGNAQAGLVYLSDALSSKKVKIIAEAPENSHKPIILPAAVIKSSKYSTEAEEFMKFLIGENAGKVFEFYGFTRIP